MRAFSLLIMFVSLSSLQQVYAGNELNTKKANVRILINGKDAYKANITITDVVGDGNCGFYSSDISRAKFYQRLRELYPVRHQIIAVIMGTFERPEDLYRQQLSAWFENALDNNEEAWLNTAGLHLMSNLFSVVITTYAYAVILGQLDRSRLTRGSVFTPLPEIQHILLNNDIVVVENEAPIDLLNLGNLHWNRIVFLSLIQFLVQAQTQAEVTTLESDTEESSSEEENYKKQKKKKKKIKVAKEEENTKKSKRKESEEDQAEKEQPQKKVRADDGNITAQAQVFTPNPNTNTNTNTNTNQNSDWVSSCTLF